MRTIRLNLRNPVNCYYGINILSEFANVLSKYQFDRLFLIADNTAYSIYGKSFTKMLEDNDIEFDEICLEALEENKSFEKLEWLCNGLIQKNISKDSIIVGFGGGMVCNVAGLAASLIFRGVKYIEIPTTLMGQTDSSISNKQAVNGKYGKNQFGIYYAPQFIWADMSYLMTEDISYVRGALVEAIKNTFIYDRDLLGPLSTLVYKDKYSEEDFLQLFEMIVNSKNRILKNDPTEEGFSMVLEYGHTIGHAIEFLTKGAIIHGEAVALCMCIMADVSFQMGFLSRDDVQLHYDTLLPLVRADSISLFKKLNVADIFAIISKDNKKRGAGINYILLKSIGQCLSKNGNYFVRIDQEIVEQSTKNFQNMRIEDFVYALQ